MKEIWGWKAPREGARGVWEARECGGESGNGDRTETETGTEREERGRDGACCARMHYACGGSHHMWID